VEGLIMTPSPRARRPRAAIASLALAVPLFLAIGGGSSLAQSPKVTEVTVERVRPQKEKLPTLQFLKENRDFVRARFDLLREKVQDQSGQASLIDARYLAYERMLAAIRADRDSATAATDAIERQQLLASITELGRLEGQLDTMDGLLAAQRGRLQILQDDFTGRQRTALVIVVSGYPDNDAVSEVTVTLEGGAKLTVPLFWEQRLALKKGGVVQVFHGFVEPREQVIQVGIAGEGWPPGDSGFVTLTPERDRMQFLRLDLTGVQPTQGVASVKASTWLNDSKPRSGDG
jgi:hypothetical protein